MGRTIISVLIVALLVLGPSAPGLDAHDVEDSKCTFGEPRSDHGNVAIGDVERALAGVRGYFTENGGQLEDGGISLYHSGESTSVAFGRTWVALDYHPSDDGKGVMVRINFDGANQGGPVGIDPLPHKSNYFIGDDPDQWVTRQSNYRGVAYPSLYDGIDLFYHFVDGRLKYEFNVASGARPSAIRMSYEGADSVAIDEATGELLISTPVGDIVDEAPITYQDLPAGRASVPSSYELLSDLTLGFRVGQWSPEFPLVIDPALNFSTFIGGFENDVSGGVIVDEDGFIYMSGSTHSSNFPTTPGAYDRNWWGLNDVFIFKMKSDGSGLVFSTYVGGFGVDVSLRTAIDDARNVLAGGWTSGMGFPTTPGVIQEDGRGAWALKLKHSGDSLVFSTFLGGSSDDRVFGLSVDTNNHVYVTGFTTSTNFLVTTGSFCTTLSGDQDAFLLKLNHNASELLYGTYIGGPGDETGWGVCADDKGYAYVFGTAESGFPTTTSAYMRTGKGGSECFAFKMNLNGSAPVYSTLISGSKEDSCDGGCLDRDGNLFLTGSTESPDFPVTDGALDTSHNGDWDAYLLKLNGTGESATFSTLFGGTGVDYGARVDVDSNGTVFLSVDTNSDDLATTGSAYDSSFNGGLFDLYLARISASGDELEYGTYLGGSDTEVTSGICRGLDYTTVAGQSKSAGFPTTAGSYQPTKAQKGDVFITQIEMGPPSVLNISRPSPPRNLTATYEDGNITLAWKGPDDRGGVWLKGYRLFRGRHPSNMNLIKTLRPDELTHVDDPGFVGVKHYYAVRAYSIAGESLDSNIANGTVYSTPSVPQELEALPGDGYVWLEWNPPSNLGGLPVMGYILFRGPERSLIQPHETLENVTSFNDTGLENNRTYCYGLLAFNAEGRGPISKILEAIPAGPPFKPRGLVIEGLDKAALLSWDPPVDDNGRDLLGYRVLRGPTEGDLSPIHVEEAGNTSYLDWGLVNTHTYYYAVLAFNEMGDGPPCPPVSVVPLGPPGVPGNLTIEADDSTITLAWEMPVNDGGSPVLGYRIYRGGRGDLCPYFTDVSTTSFADTGLFYDSPYYYRVSAYNAVGEGDLTDVVFETCWAPPRAPRSLVAEGGDGMIELRWERPLTSGTTYVESYIVLRGVGPGELSQIDSVAVGSLTYTDGNVTVGQVYHYAVASDTNHGRSPWSDTAEAFAFGPAGPPVNLTAVAGDDTVKLSWEPPEDTGHSEVLVYVIYKGQTPAALSKLTEVHPPLTYTDGEVMDGTTYYYAVAAYNAAGLGETSSHVEATPGSSSVIPPEAQPPSAPTSIDGELEGTSLLLTWSSPLQDGGRPVSGFIVLRGTSPDDLERVDDVDLVHLYLDEDLERGTTYYYQVVARNDVGDGEPSAVFELTVEKEGGGTDDSPGFLAPLAAVTLALTALALVRRRRGDVLTGGD